MPVPSWMPRTIHNGIFESNSLMSPTADNKIKRNETDSEAAAICGIVKLDNNAIAEIDFIGWTHMGIPKNKPLKMLKMPPKISDADSEIRPCWPTTKREWEEASPSLPQTR